MKKRRARLRDFLMRAKADPDSLRTLGSLGRYLAVNPMSDETELLEKFGVEASICLKVDLYWAHHDDVWFVQVHGQEYAVDRGPGIYARLAPSGYINVVVVVPERIVSSTTVERALREVATRKVRRKSLPDGLKQI